MAELSAAKSPIDVCEDMMGRQTGRTTKMIMSLPADGRAAILVTRQQMAEKIIRMIKSLRPGYPCAKLRFSSRADALRGIDVPVYVDNAVTDRMNMDFIQSIQPPRVEAGK